MMALLTVIQMYKNKHDLIVGTDKIYYYSRKVHVDEEELNLLMPLLLAGETTACGVASLLLLVDAIRRSSSSCNSDAL